jgi:hypothetical protein
LTFRDEEDSKDRSITLGEARILNEVIKAVDQIRTQEHAEKIAFAKTNSSLNELIEVRG